MSRLEEVEARLAHTVDSGWPSSDEAAEYRHLSRTLAAEVDARDDAITKLLAMLKPMPQEKFQALRYAEDISHEDCCRELHRRACEIAGRTE